MKTQIVNRDGREEEGAREKPRLSSPRPRFVLCFHVLACFCRHPSLVLLLRLGDWSDGSDFCSKCCLGLCYSSSALALPLCCRTRLASFTPLHGNGEQCCSLFELVAKVIHVSCAADPFIYTCVNVYVGVCIFFCLPFLSRGSAPTC